MGDRVFATTPQDESGLPTGHHETDLLRAGEAYCFIEQEVVMLKAVSDHGDPIELSPREAGQLGRQLLKLSEEATGPDQASDDL